MDGIRVESLEGNPNITMPLLNLLGLSTGIDIVKIIQINYH
jgi:hypothetical protein